MTKFKVGDTVKINKPICGKSYTGVVTEIVDHYRVDVLWDSWGYPYRYYLNELELVEQQMEYKPNVWYGWNCGRSDQPPVHPETIVEVIWVHANGGCKFHEDRCAKEIYWKDNEYGNIVAFKIIKEHKEPREWWISPGNDIVSDKPMPTYIKDWVHVKEIADE